MSEKGKSKAWALFAILIMLTSALSFGGGYKWAEATLPTADGVWGQWFRDAYVWVSTKLHLDYTTANRVLITDSGKNATTDADLTWVGGDTLQVTNVSANDVYTSSLYVNGYRYYNESQTDYLVWQSGTNYYYKNTHSGLVSYSSNATLALTNAVANGGSTYVKAGTYNLDRCVFLPSNTTLIGDGIGKTIFYLINGANSPIFVNKNYATSDSNIIICNIEINANKASNTEASAIYSGLAYSYPIGFFHVSNAQVENCLLTNTKAAAITLSYCSNSFIEKNIISNTYSHGIELYNSTTTIIKSNNLIGNSALAGYAGGITVQDNSSQIIVEDNTITNDWNAGGIKIAVHALNPAPDKITIKNNHVTSTVTNGYYCLQILGRADYGANVTNVIVSGNDFYQTKNGNVDVYIAGTRNVLFENNVIDAAFTDYSGAGMNVDYSQRISIQNNIFRNIGYYAIDLRTQVLYFSVQNNLFEHIRYAIATTTSTPKYGIVSGNNGINCNAVITSEIMGLSTVKIYGNLGVSAVTENTVTATILNTTTSIVIHHGLSYTPSATNTDWSIIPTELSTNDPGQFYVDTFDSLHATIHCRNDPGASNLDITISMLRIP